MLDADSVSDGESVAVAILLREREYVAVADAVSAATLDVEDGSGVANGSVDALTETLARVLFVATTLAVDNALPDKLLFFEK